MPIRPKTGVGGTVDAFNFIRRVAFPSTRGVIFIFATTGLVASFLSLPIEGEDLAQTLVFAGAIFVWPGVAGEIVNAMLLLRKDRILDFRRLMGIEIISGILMGAVLFIFSLIGAIFRLSNFWVQGFFLGLIVSLPVRFLTPVAMSSMSSWRKLLAGLPTPLLTTFAFLILSPGLSSSLNPTIAQIGVLFASGILISGLGVSLIVRRVEIQGTAEIHHSPMGLFRSFLEHWLRKTPTSLEERLLALSTEGSIETKILSFRGSDQLPKASIVVSNFHPGPYRDMGSGGLPSQMKHFLEESGHGVVQVPHGVSNHKLNIVSHRDIDKLLSAARENYPLVHPNRQASAMIREQEGEAKVSGQAFGSVAVLTVTLAPQEMEDLPTEVSTEIDREASKRGFVVLLIDAHNSLVGQTSITSLQAERIIRAAVKVLDKLVSLPQGPFKVGSDYDPLQVYSLKDGIGPGGLSAIVIKTASDTTAYVTIDGNNMQRGLRERILQSINEIGISDGEVMTTDTHLVTGLVRSPLGYYPVGEHLPTDQFIQAVTNTVRNAAASTEDSSTGFSKFSQQLQVLGSDTFQSITGFIGRIAREIGRAFYWLEISSLAVALIILFVL